MKKKPGYEWRETSQGTGYWVKQKSKGRHSYKLAMFCPHCSRITGTIDDSCLLEYGFCKTCYVMYVEDRKQPVIDIEYYKNKLISS